MALPDLHDLAKAIVATVRTPLLVLDHSLVVVEANQAFYRTFRTTEAETVGRALQHLGDGQRDLLELRALLENVPPAQKDFPVEHEFPSIGRRHTLLNARQIVEHGGEPLILLPLEDLTERHRAPRSCDDRTKSSSALPKLLRMTFRSRSVRCWLSEAGFRVAISRRDGSWSTTRRVRNGGIGQLCVRTR